MRIVVTPIGEALHPSELVVQVATEQGPQNLVVDKQSVKDNSISVGSPLGRRDKDFWLVELPRETMNGAWRVWVATDQLINENKAVRAA